MPGVIIVPVISSVWINATADTENDEGMKEFMPQHHQVYVSQLQCLHFVLTGTKQCENLIEN